VLAPPPPLGSSRVRMLTDILPALERGVHAETNVVAISFPARSSNGELQPCPAAFAEGRAVCVAGATPEGVGSVGQFKRHGEGGWEEAHAQLDWLCVDLRRLLSKGQIEEHEDAVFRIGPAG
jgi:hypothetical protein